MSRPLPELVREWNDRLCGGSDAVYAALTARLGIEGLTYEEIEDKIAAWERAVAENKLTQYCLDACRCDLEHARRSRGECSAALRDTRDTLEAVRAQCRRTQESLAEVTRQRDSAAGALAQLRGEEANSTAQFRTTINGLKSRLEVALAERNEAIKDLRKAQAGSRAEYERAERLFNDLWRSDNERATLRAAVEQRDLHLAAQREDIRSLAAERDDRDRDLRNWESKYARVRRALDPDGTVPETKATLVQLAAALRGAYVCAFPHVPVAAHPTIIAAADAAAREASGVTK